MDDGFVTVSDLRRTSILVGRVRPIETDRNLAFFADVGGTVAGDFRTIGGDAGIRYRF